MEPARPTPYDVALRGEVDLSVAASLSRLAGRFEAGAARDARVDLRAVTFFDSSDLGSWRGSSVPRTSGGSVTVAGPCAAVQRLLDVSGLSGLAPLFVVEP